jgi:hypothetical protein
MSAPDAHTVRLPGGYVDATGAVHYEVDLAPLTGAGEELLASARPDTPAAELATIVLSHTVKRVGGHRRVTPGMVRDLLVQDREYLLVRVLETLQGRKLWVRLDCPACAESLEVALMLDEVPVVSRPVAALYAPFDERLEFRLPTGADQEWAASSPANDNAGLALLGRCVRHRKSRRGVDTSRLRADMRAALEQRMAETAPDMTLDLDATCPDCSHPFSTILDLTHIALGELRSSTRRLEEEVHTLAWHYHWPESEIMKMSRPKRARYVRLIRDQLEAG